MSAKSAINQVNDFQPDRFEYWVGGSLPLEVRSYVRRQADEDLYAGLMAGEFCYVLNARQMGKSSLRVRTMKRLQDAGVICVAIDDITAIGSTEVTAEQWYLGLVWEIVKQVRGQTEGLKDWNLMRVRGWWQERDGLPFVQRWGEFIEGVLLAEVTQKVVIFVDEIDSVLGLPFRADDFFAAIRECYNRRVDVPSYERLTFALLGVCAPQDLIQDRRRTPFNIGRSIELLGFSYEEAIGLADGLPDGEAMLREILNWTGGQPFLTQRVCRLSVNFPESPIQSLIQTQIIQAWESNDEQVHFQTIQNLVMANESIATALLGLYQRVLNEGGVAIEASDEQLALRLTGIVVKRGDRVQVANRIYEQVFGADWVEKKLAELRPYGEVFQKWQETKDDRWLLQGDDLRKAQAWSDEDRRKLASEDYQFLSRSQTIENKAELQIEQQAKNTLTIANRKAKRMITMGGGMLSGSLIAAGLAWGLWTLTDLRLNGMTVKNHVIRGEMRTALNDSMDAYRQFRPLQVGSFLNKPFFTKTEDSVTTALQTSINGEFQEVGNFVDSTNNEFDLSSMVFSPDGQTIASGSDDNTVKLWSQGGKLINTLKGHESAIKSVAFSPDGQTIASGSGDGTIRLWSRDGKLLDTVKSHDSYVGSVVFSPDGQTIASASMDGTVKIWNKDGKLLHALNQTDSGWKGCGAGNATPY